MLAEDEEMKAEQEAMMAAYNNEHQIESSDYDFEEGDNGQFGFGFGMNGKFKRNTFYFLTNNFQIIQCIWMQLSKKWHWKKLK